MADARELLNSMDYVLSRADGATAVLGDLVDSMELEGRPLRSLTYTVMMLEEHMKELIRLHGEISKAVPPRSA